jgi:hypothetical protein
MGISFCECDDPQPDPHDCCFSCGEEFASNRVKNLHLCNCKDPLPDFSIGSSKVPCLRCGKENGDIQKKQMDYIRKIANFPNAPFRIMGNEVPWYVWLVYAVFFLPIISLIKAIDKANQWNSDLIDRRKKK